MNSVVEAYTIGKRLALAKFSEDLTEKADTTIDSAEGLTAAFQALLGGRDEDATPGEVLDDPGERAGSSSWGDKFEVEDAASGIVR
jgi:hypothetical protein